MKALVNDQHACAPSIVSTIGAPKAIAEALGTYGIIAAGASAYNVATLCLGFKGAGASMEDGQMIWQTPFRQIFFYRP